MTGIFDGMAGVVSDTLGASVVYLPKVGASQTVRAVFRARPIEVATEDGGAVLIVAPTLRVRRDLLPDIGRGDRVQPSTAPGKTFEVINAMPSGSPASDGFILCELEDVTE